MAAKEEGFEEISVGDAQNTQLFKLLVPKSVAAECQSDPNAASILYTHLCATYGTETGMKTLDLVESLTVILQLGFVKEWTQQAQGSGVHLGKGAEFDTILEAAVHNDPGIPDEALFCLAKHAPRDLTAQEKVRFMEVAVASMKDVSEAGPSAGPSSGSSSKLGTSYHCEHETEKDETGNEWDETESIFSQHSQESSQLESCTVTKKREIQWQRTECLLLIELKKEHDTLFDNSKFKKRNVWQQIATRMREKGYMYSGAECDNKWRSLSDRYKKNKSKAGKSGRGGIKWPLYGKMDDYYESDPAVNPIVSVSSLQPSCPATPVPHYLPHSVEDSAPVHTTISSNQSVCEQVPPSLTPPSESVPCSTPSTSTQCTPKNPKSPIQTPRRKRRATDDNILLLPLRNDLLRMHEERIEIERKRLEMLEKIYELLKKQK